MDFIIKSKRFAQTIYRFFPSLYIHDKLSSEDIKFYNDDSSIPAYYTDNIENELIMNPYALLRKQETSFYKTEYNKKHPYLDSYSKFIQSRNLKVISHIPEKYEHHTEE